MSVRVIPFVLCAPFPAMVHIIDHAGLKEGKPNMALGILYTRGSSVAFHRVVQQLLQLCLQALVNDIAVVSISLHIQVHEGL